MPKTSAKVKKDPKVVVFGQEVGDSQDKNYQDRHGKWFSRPRRHGSLTFGLFFILIGLLFLLSNFGSLPPVVWSQVAKLWPILLILIGVETMLGHSDFGDFISSLISLFIFLTILGVVFVIFAPQLVVGLPTGILNYLNSIVGYLHIR